MDTTNPPNLPVINYPLYTDQPELSGAWRINRSQMQVLELANCLKALKKVIGTISTEELNIAFNSQDQSLYTASTKTILIDPRFAFEAKTFPIPTHDFDVLVAHGIHEAFHNQAKSDAVREEIRKPIKSQQNSISSTNRVSQDVQVLADKISIVGEEVYVDNAARRQSDLLYRYIYKARLAYRGEVTEKDPDWNDPITAWGATGIYGILPPTDIEPYILDCLAVFNVLQQNLAGWELKPQKRTEYYRQAAIDVDKIIEKNKITKRLKGGNTSNQEPGGPLKLGSDSGDSKDKKDEDDEGSEEFQEGENKALKAAKEYVEALGDNPTNEEPKPLDGNFDSGDDRASALEEMLNGMFGKTKGEHNPKKPHKSSDYTPDPNIKDAPSELSLTPFHSDTHISLELAKEIVDALESKMEDITQEILNEYSQENIEINKVPKAIIWSQSQKELDPNFDETLARELIWLRQLKNKIGRQTFRSENHGKLDPTRLHRINHSNDVFKTSKQRDRQTLDLVLVVDASGSMHGKGQKIYEAVKALRHALPDTKVISYDSDLDNSIDIQVQMENTPMRAIEPGGETPSGPAILAAVKRFPKSLLIHFSDGGANVGPSLKDTFTLINEKYPSTRIVNIEYPFQRTEIDLPNIQNLELTDIDDFPDLIKGVLKEWQMEL